MFAVEQMWIPSDERENKIGSASTSCEGRIVRQQCLFAVHSNVGFQERKKKVPLPFSWKLKLEWTACESERRKRGRRISKQTHSSDVYSSIPSHSKLPLSYRSRISFPSPNPNRNTRTAKAVIWLLMNLKTIISAIFKVVIRFEWFSPVAPPSPDSWRCPVDNCLET